MEGRVIEDYGNFDWKLSSSLHIINAIYAGALLGITAISLLSYFLVRDILRLKRAKNLIGSILGNSGLVEVKYVKKRPRQRQLNPWLEVSFSIDKNVGSISCSAYRLSDAKHWRWMFVSTAVGVFRLLVNSLTAESVVETSVGSFQVLLKGDENLTGNFCNLSEDVKSRISVIFEQGFRSIKIQDYKIVLAAKAMHLNHPQLGTAVRGLRADLLKLVTELSNKMGEDYPS